MTNSKHHQNTLVTSPLLLRFSNSCVATDCPSRLFKLDQNPGAVFRMEKHDRFSMGADSRLRAQTSNFLSLQILNCLLNIVDFDANMMNPAILILVEKSLNRALFTQWFEKLDFCVVQIDENDRNSMLG